MESNNPSHEGLGCERMAVNLYQPQMTASLCTTSKVLLPIQEHSNFPGIITKFPGIRPLVYAGQCATKLHPHLI
jgi:hypothetical protein